MSHQNTGVCQRGRSGLLYGSMEHHTPARQISQAVLLQHEARLIREAFNQQFEVTQAAKRDLIVSLDEKLARITNIERELSLHPQAAATSAILVSRYLWLCMELLLCT